MRNSNCYYILHTVFWLVCFPQAVTVLVHKLGIAKPPIRVSTFICLSLLSFRKQNAVFLKKICTGSNSGAMRCSAYLYLSSRVDNVISEVSSGLQLFINHLHAPTSLLLFCLFRPHLLLPCSLTAASTTSQTH